jgi:hypothetical protein
MESTRVEVFLTGSNSHHIQTYDLLLDCVCNIEGGRTYQSVPTGTAMGVIFEDEA